MPTGRSRARRGSLLLYDPYPPPQCHPRVFPPERADDPAEGFPAHRSVFREFAGVLKPGGVLPVSTCSQEQLRHGYWHYHLIPEAADALRNRYLPLDELREILDDCGLAHRGTFAPIDATVQGDSYFDSRGPLSKEWRDGDSVWSLVAEDRLNRALSRIRTLDERGSSRPTWPATTPRAPT